MKFTKLSLAAIVAMGVASGAFAVENVKVDGQVKLWYETVDKDGSSTDLFDKEASSGDLVAKLRATGDLTKRVGFGTTVYAVTTLGLENKLVGAEAIGTTSTESAGLNGSDKLPMWLGEAYFTYKAGNTIAKIGRQELDTPLAFTETWNAAPNTFEAAVLINQDIPNTTLIGAYVSRGNGWKNSDFNATTKTYTANIKTVSDGSFYDYHANSDLGDKEGGAYVAAAVFSGIPNATLAGFYYDVVDTAQAYWLEGSYNVPGIAKIEALYASLDACGPTEDTLKALNVTDRETDAFAVRVSGEVAGVKLGASYSDVSEGVLPVGNTATGFVGTKLYTASNFSHGMIAAQPDVSAWKVEASTKVAGFDLAASYASYDVGENKGGHRAFVSKDIGLTDKNDPAEFDLSVGTKVGDINVALQYFNLSEIDAQKHDEQAVRVVASIDF